MPKQKPVPSITSEIRANARANRDVAIATCYNAGIPASRLAAIAGLTMQRIRQIAEQYNDRLENPFDATTETKNGSNRRQRRRVSR